VGWKEEKGGGRRRGGGGAVMGGVWGSGGGSREREGRVGKRGGRAWRTWGWNTQVLAAESSFGLENNLSVSKVLGKNDSPNVGQSNITHTQ